MHEILIGGHGSEIPVFELPIFQEPKCFNIEMYIKIFSTSQENNIVLT